MKVAYLKDNKIVSIVLADNMNQLLPMDKSFQNMIDLSGFSPEPSVGWSFIDNAFIDPTETLNSSPTKKITKLAFLNRFTLTELTNYYTAVNSSALLKVLDSKMNVSTFIDLSRPDLIQGVQMLAQAGILTSERANEILTAPISEIESYKD